MADARVSVLIDLRSKLAGLEVAAQGFTNLIKLAAGFATAYLSVRSVVAGARDIIELGAELERLKARTGESASRMIFLAIFCRFRVFEREIYYSALSRPRVPLGCAELRKTNMFWHSVFNGLGILLHWQTYVVAVMYIIISFLPFAGLMLSEDKADGLMEKGGCLIMLIQPLFQVFAVFICVCTLFPLMMGGTEAAWSLPWTMLYTNLGRTLMIMVIMLIFSIIGAIVPVLGRNNSFIMLIMGGTVLALLIHEIQRAYPGLSIGRVELIPGFFTIIGFVIASAISSWIGILVAAAAVTHIFKGREEIGQLIMIPLGSVVGFIPIAMYGAWIALQVRSIN